MARITYIEGEGPECESLGGMTLAAIPESVATARRWFRKLTESYELGCSVDDCVLLISELVTNAIVYGEHDEPWLVRVNWWRAGERLRVDVHNPGFPANVRLRRPDADEAHGRGLCLVDRLAESWAAGPGPDGGTVVAFFMAGAWKPGQPTRRRNGGLPDA